MNFSSGPLGNGTGWFFFPAFCRVWLSLFLPVLLRPRSDANKPLQQSVTAVKCPNVCHTPICVCLIAVALTCLLPQVAVISCQWLTRTTATGQVCFYPKSWSCSQCEHDITSFKMEGTTSINDPLKPLSYWEIIDLWSKPQNLSNPISQAETFDVKADCP